MSTSLTIPSDGKCVTGDTLVTVNVQPVRHRSTERILRVWRGHQKSRESLGSDKVS